MSGHLGPAIVTRGVQALHLMVVKQGIHLIILNASEARAAAAEMIRIADEIDGEQK